MGKGVSKVKLWTHCWSFGEKHFISLELKFLNKRWTWKFSIGVNITLKWLVLPFKYIGLYLLKKSTRVLNIIMLIVSPIPASVSRIHYSTRILQPFHWKRVDLNLVNMQKSYLLFTDFCHNRFYLKIFHLQRS